MHKNTILYSYSMIIGLEKEREYVQFTELNDYFRKHIKF